MAHSRAVARPLARQLGQRSLATPSRAFTAGQPSSAEVQAAAPTTSEPSSPLDQNPNTVSREWESHLISQGKMPIGSRRRRAAIRFNSHEQLPFEQLPYQTFQEARKILAADRLEKLAAIKLELGRISEAQKRDVSSYKGGQQAKDTSIRAMTKNLETLKILADINDPVVKKRFEDGLGDLNKPIYRYYAERKWKSYDHRLIAQRISQFKIVPDILPKFEPTADVQLYFRKRKVPPGEIVDSLVSERPPHLRVQVFDKGERLVTVVVMDADVPDLEKDGFSKRCHFMAVNIAISPTQTSLPFHFIKADNRVVPWHPPTSQKGAPYHRISIFLLEQPANTPLDPKKLREMYSQQAHFSLKSFRDKLGLKPFGFNMFRTVWDDNTAGVMARHGIEGADMELHTKRVYSLKPEVKPRGWEAKRQSGKYRHLWKYTKRIRGISNNRGWIKRR